MIISEAASIATRSMRDGLFHISRRCFTIRLSSSLLTWKLFRLRVTSCSLKPPSGSCAMCFET